MSSTPDPTADARPDDGGFVAPEEPVDAVAATDETPEIDESAVTVEVVEVEVGVLDALLVDLVDEAVEADADVEVVEVDVAVVEPDPSLFEAHDLALAALREITSEASIGEPADYRVEPDGVVSLRFANRLPGYPGWFWTVSLARVEGSEPTVLEVELLPGDGALLAPDWVPWAERLAEYHAAQAALAEAAHADDEEEDDESADELDDVDDLDAADFDDDGSPILHAGDLDGVDIDVLDASADEESDEDDSDDEDDDSDEDDSDEDDSDEDDER
ncbi:DUF3027 domain-containing protein [Microbacterium sp. NPDC058389]|uniref:DUF3027 domain-containing protein n=1 Tax=Microbacterium sp. NPDC058389 TaxID=3346475 RepID=UPI003666A062